jgi:hypothetical protein
VTLVKNRKTSFDETEQLPVTVRDISGKEERFRLTKFEEEQICFCESRTGERDMIGVSGVP